MSSWNIEKLRGQCKKLDGFSWPRQWRTVENPVPASVLIPLVEHESDFGLLLTRRTEHLRHHPGQVCFPGGRHEAEDGSPIATALRETQEEIGLAASAIEILGCLPQFPVPSGFLITPVLGVVRPPLNLKPDALEVADIFEVPLDFIVQRTNYQQHRTDWSGATRQIHSISYCGKFIWGATAGMLAMLADFLTHSR